MKGKVLQPKKKELETYKFDPYLSDEEGVDISYSEVSDNDIDIGWHSLQNTEWDRTLKNIYEEMNTTAAVRW